MSGFDGVGLAWDIIVFVVEESVVDDGDEFVDMCGDVIAEV